MQRRHGDAERILSQQHMDLDRVDQAIRSGGVDDEEAMRMLIANDFLGPNRFGKMFPDLEPFRPADDTLINLGLAMSESPAQLPSTALDSTIPAGFTYLAQFIDHDITFDPTLGFPVIHGATERENARTPTVDIDSVYGLGPERQPFFYDQNFPSEQAKFAIGLTSPLPSPDENGVLDTLQVSLPNDLPRRGQIQGSKIDNIALIADPRNDENLILAQTHLAFLKFHNKVMDTLLNTLPPDGNGADGETAFDKLSRIVRWHYQWIVLNDFLPRVVDPSILDDVKENGRKLYNFDNPPFNGTPFMPVEFSVAAYRLGHTMVREAYNHNRVFHVGKPGLTVATLSLLFRFTGGGGFVGDHHALPSNWIIDWRRFYEVGDPRPRLVNVTRRLDTLLSPTLFNLPVQPPIISSPPIQLAVRNLLRGSRVGLPTAQDVVAALQDANVGVTGLSTDEILSGPGNQARALRAGNFQNRTPLWFYILKEAEVQGQGNRLGDVGSRILSEVFVGLLEGDANSFLSQRPDWTPTLPSADPGNFTMADLLNFVGDLNPLGPLPDNL